MQLTTDIFQAINRQKWGVLHILTHYSFLSDEKGWTHKKSTFHKNKFHLPRRKYNHLNTYLLSDLKCLLKFHGSTTKLPRSVHENYTHIGSSIQLYASQQLCTNDLLMKHVTFVFLRPIPYPITSTIHESSVEASWNFRGTLETAKRDLFICLSGSYKESVEGRTNFRKSFFIYSAPS